MFSMIAARLERCKADIEEQGHQRVRMLEAQTAKDTAQLIGQAKGQYLAAVGRALAALKESPRVFEAFQQLHELSQLRPHRMLAFKGFKDGEVRAFDAAMFAAMGNPDSAHPLPATAHYGAALQNGPRPSERLDHGSSPVAARRLQDPGDGQ
jgi:hypothetical protein